MKNKDLSMGETFESGAFHHEFCQATGHFGGKQRAAAYCRVSTLSEEQGLSFESQVKYYTELIGRDPNLVAVGIYGDHGFSGLEMSKRKEFGRMINDCEKGLIDLIYVKSVSRFSRNAADAISVVKRLNDLGVRVLFEKEGLDSADPATEMVLNLYATMAQNESCSLGQSISWAYMHRAKLGNPTRNACYGYRIERRPNDSFRYWVIDEEQAKHVRQIFHMAWQGYSFSEISEATGFSGSRIKSVLANEAYRGDLLTHKLVQMDYATKKTIKNNGQREQVFIEAHHAPIVEPAVFDEVGGYLKRGVLNSRRGAARKEWLLQNSEILARRNTGD